MNAKEFVLILKNCKNSDYWPDYASDICGGKQRRYKLVGKLADELEALGYILHREDGYDGEGCGDEYWGVFSVEDSKNPENKTFFEIRGWYASFNGAEIEAWDFYKVEKVPVQKYEWHQVKE